MYGSNTLVDAVNQASSQWKAAFNAHDAKGCAAQYEEDAVIHAKPFGDFEGRSEIQAFWQQIMDNGLSDVEYINPSLEVIDDTTVKLQSEWRMNNAKGVITNEVWVRQSDGSMKLRLDEFEAIDAS
ncbi:MAG: nuclear transport factor 2 family protein [Cellvibrionales bacterium]|nr:nuclear transport factor 2 family protein [Cellvibrionales bacterium]